jgi:hypothetical protein
MAPHALRSRSRLLLAPALTLAVASPLAFASTASACWCPTGMHESAPGSETCVADTPKPAPETVTPPVKETPATETPAPETTPAPAPAPVVEQAAAPAPAPAAAPAPAPAAAEAAPAPAVASGTPEAPAAEEEQGEVLGEHVSSKPRAEHTVAAAPTANAAPVVQTAAAGELPFTGLDTGLIAIMGAGLLGTGVVLRRRTQPTA